jgi:hypothetical protein
MSNEGRNAAPQTVKSPRAEAPQPNAPHAVEQGEHFGRSPDLLVIAWPDLPAAVRQGGTSRLRSPLTVAGVVVDLAHFGPVPHSHFIGRQAAQKKGREP